MSYSNDKILAFSTKGRGSNDENRLKELLCNTPHSLFAFDYEKKIQSFISLLKYIIKKRPSLVVMEGSGFFGGFALLITKLFFNVPYIFSSGDAIAPFLKMKYGVPEFFFRWYECWLYKHSLGFIGWSPYLVGRAITLGAKKGITIEGWANFNLDPEDIKKFKTEIKKSYDIPANAIVFGIVGTITWNSIHQYAYGLELIQAAQACNNENIYIFIIGDGNGINHLKAYVTIQKVKNVYFLGHVSQNDLVKYICAFDFASLPLSVDAVGSFRYTYKISEYLACNVSILSTQIPAAYDLNLPKITTFDGKNPWDKKFIRHLSTFMQHCSPPSESNFNDPHLNGLFNKEVQIKRFELFLNDLLRNN